MRSKHRNVLTLQTAETPLFQVATRIWNYMTWLAYRRPATLVIVAILFGFALRLYHLDLRTLFGDEYNSLLEADQLGRNVQSLLYFSILHLWLHLGASDFWARFLSVILGVLAIPVGYQFGCRAVNQRTGFILAYLLALSSFAIEYSQEIRFYSLFLLTTTLSLVSFVPLRNNPTSAIARLVWMATSLMVILSHLFGVLVPLFELVAWWLGSAPGFRKIKRLGLLLLLLFGLMVVAPQFVNSDTFSTLERVIGGNATAVTVHSRGFGLANVAKIPITLFFFSLGQSIYPLDLPFSAIGIIVFAAAALNGLLFCRNRQHTLMLILTGLTLLVLVYLVLDPAAPSFSETASPRHVIMVLPVYLLLIASGLVVFRSNKIPLAIVGLVSLYALVQYYAGSWSYTIPVNVDWKDLAGQVTRESTPKTVLLNDGRSTDPVARYFAPDLNKSNIWSYLGGNNLGDLADAERIIFLTNDFQADHRKTFDQVLGLIEREFVFKSGHVDYPVFKYTFDKKPTGQSLGYQVDKSTGEIALPKEIYGIEFQDLSLPTSATFDGKTYLVLGDFMLPSLQGNIERSIPLLEPVQSDGLIFLSNVTDARALRSNAFIGDIIVETSEQERLVFPIRLGNETQEWSKDCDRNTDCQVVLSWHKYLSLTGQRAYEGAWNDFQARIFGVNLHLPKLVAVKSIVIRYAATAGQLHVWGMGLHLVSTNAPYP